VRGTLQDKSSTSLLISLLKMKVDPIDSQGLTGRGLLFSFPYFASTCNTTLKRFGRMSLIQI
jgi:hypothetical protein